MDKRRKILIGLIVLDVIILGVAIVLTIKLINAKDNENDMQNVIENKIENVIENTDTNEIVNETENIIEQKEKEEPEEEQITADPTQEVEESVIEQQRSNEEKAEDIAKKAWGNDNSVNFQFDYIDSNGLYIVIVRDDQTHEVGRYKINVNTGKVIE